jgi:hypothetical protein
MNPTFWFLIVWIAALVLWDTWVLVRLGPDFTISALLLRWSLRWPFLPLAAAFGLGILTGHLFWPQTRK